MGIKNFYSTFRKIFQQSIRSNSKINHDVLIIELNGLFYSAIRHLYEEKKYKNKNDKQFHRELFHEITRQLEMILLNNIPKQKVFLTVDGIAGMMKFREQQQRRYKNVLEKKYDKFDLNAFTPGTKLMHHLTKYIDYFLRHFMNSNNSYQDIEIIFSNEKVMGEGESKIFRLMDQFCSPSDQILIYNCDSDIVCLSIVSDKKIIICRKSFLYGTEYIDIETCRKQILKKITWDNTIWCQRYLTDFIIMLFFVGNDYVDSSPVVTNFQIFYQNILSIYRKNKKFLTEYNPGENCCWSINYQNLSYFIKDLAKLEKKLFFNKFTEHTTFPNILLRKCQKDPKFSFEKYMKEYQKKYFGTTSLETVAKDYFSALEEYLMIFLQKKVSSFSYKYVKSPFFSQLCNYTENPTFNNQIVPQENFFYLMLILPPQSKCLLPSCFEDFFEQMNIDFPSFLEIDLSGKRTLWEGFLNLPELNIQNAVNYYNKRRILMKTSDVRRNTPGKEFYYCFRKGFPKEDYHCYYGTIHNNQVHVGIVK